MKKILLFSMLFAGALYVSPARAQVSVHVNIGSQPSWGPVGYDYVDYYYLPDIQVFYNVPARTFLYFDQGRWINSPFLPSCYRGYDLYSGYKVIVNEPNPWMHYNYYTRRYAPHGRYGRQIVIRDSRDSRYHRDNDDYRGRNDNRRNDRYNNDGYGRRDDNRNNDRYNNDGNDRRRGRGDLHEGQ